MSTQPEEISRQSSPFLPSEDLRQSGYASSTGGSFTEGSSAEGSSAEGSSAEGSSAGGSGEGPKGRRRSLQVIILLVDVAVLVLSLGHLALTIVLMCYNGRHVDASYDTLQSVLTTIGPIFPMVFAFIVSRLLYHVARYRLENGASLGTLEQLMGSRTVGSAVATHFELRAFNMLGLLILFVWVFSPLGGQSFLRVLDMAHPPANTSVFYMNTLEMTRGFHNTSFKDSSYMSAFYSSDSGRPGPRDLWGNIKIPLLDVDSKSDVWHKIDHDTASYSAFVGIPIGNVSVGNSTFNIESSHLQLDCDPVTSHRLDNSTPRFLLAETPISEIELDEANTFPFDAMNDYNGTFPLTEGGRGFRNGSWYGFQHVRSEWVRWNIALNRFVDKFWLTAYYWRCRMNPTKYAYHSFHSMSVFENETGIEAGPTYLLFQARRNVISVGIVPRDVSADVQKAKCLVLQKYVESRVTCSRATHESTADCRVESQRPSQKQHPSENLSMLSHPRVFAYLSRNLPTALLTTNVGDPVLWSISDQPEPLDGTRDPDFTSISASQLSRGLTKLINSYILVHQANTNLLPRQLSGISQVDFESIETRLEWRLVSAETTHLTTVFSVSWPWMAACFASCVVLAACGIMGTILVHRGNSPEILGFVSAVVRDSRYIKIPTDVDHMNGEDLSRMLKSERLRYGYTRIESRGAPQMGIGRETEITKVEG